MDYEIMMNAPNYYGLLNKETGYFETFPDLEEIAKRINEEVEGAEFELGEINEHASEMFDIYELPSGGNPLNFSLDLSLKVKLLG